MLLQLPPLLFLGYDGHRLFDITACAAAVTYCPLLPSVAADQQLLPLLLPLAGFLSLGHRPLVLSFLAQELPQYSQPLLAAEIGRRETRCV